MNYICNVTVWYRAWLDNDEKLQVTDGPTCAKVMVKRQLGGVSQPSSLDHAPKEVIDALDFAACALNDRSNAMFLSVVGDKSGITYTHQVTSGMTFVFSNVPMVETQCRKSGACADTQNLDACAVKDHGGMSQTCEVTVQWQAWMTPAYTLSKTSCSSKCQRQSGLEKAKT
nr:hypothetical protein BaRGS_007460 [Batillaria attramentaria]